MTFLRRVLHGTVAVGGVEMRPEIGFSVASQDQLPSLRTCTPCPDRPLHVHDDVGLTFGQADVSHRPKSKCLQGHCVTKWQKE